MLHLRLKMICASAQIDVSYNSSRLNTIYVPDKIHKRRQYNSIYSPQQFHITVSLRKYLRGD